MITAAVACSAIDTTIARRNDELGITRGCTVLDGRASPQ
jgi:hypothetical protein